MYKFNLLENANDSLEHAIQHLALVNKNGSSDWKRIIVDIAHVVELLFKETLRRKHPAFILDNIDKYPSDDPITVGAEKALKRLQNICNIKFSTDELNAINTARKKRNEIEHFEFSITEHEAKTIVGQVLLFIFGFADEHLHLEWRATHLREGNWWILRQYTEFYANLLRKAQERINADGINVIKCTSCHNEAFDVDEERCLVCGHAEEVLECRWCKEPYIFSSCVYGEEAALCPNCEDKDGYASANFEKY